MSNCENIQGRITSKERNQIVTAVKHGDYMTVSDFVRQAVREKLERDMEKNTE